MLVSALGVLCVFGAGDPQKRIRVSGEVLNEILDAKDKAFRTTCWGKPSAWA